MTPPAYQFVRQFSPERRLKSNSSSTEAPGERQTWQGAKLGVPLGSSGNSRSWSGCRAQHTPHTMWELPVCTAGHCGLVLPKTMEGPRKSHCRIMSHELKYIINILGKLI